MQNDTGQPTTTRKTIARIATSTTITIAIALLAGCESTCPCRDDPRQSSLQQTYASNDSPTPIDRP